MSRTAALSPSRMAEEITTMGDMGQLTITSGPACEPQQSGLARGDPGPAQDPETVIEADPVASEPGPARDPETVNEADPVASDPGPARDPGSETAKVNRVLAGWVEGKRRRAESEQQLQMDLDRYARDLKKFRWAEWRAKQKQKEQLEEERNRRVRHRARMAEDVEWRNGPGAAMRRMGKAIAEACGRQMALERLHFRDQINKGQASRAARRVAAIRALRLTENKDVEMEDNVEFIGVVINVD